MRRREGNSEGKNALNDNDNKEPRKGQEGPERDIMLFWNEHTW